MKLEDQKLLMKDLCARLPYGVKFKHKDWDVPLELTRIYKSVKHGTFIINERIFEDDLNDFKPYLRSMSSMTKEERKDFIECAGYEVEESQNGRHYDYYLKDFCGTEDAPCANADAIDWLNENMFDYRGLIEKGLALAAPKGMYK